MDTIQNDAVVSLAYTLKLSNGEVIDFSEKDDPLEYLHGADNIIPGLEKELTGLRLGDAKEVRVSPEEGYGEYDPDDVEVVPRTELPTDFPLKLGMVVGIEDEDGETFEAYVREIGQNDVTLDFNHPLAGQPLFFSVEVLGIREANAEELAHGHPHGAHMHDEDDFEDDDFEDFDEAFEDDEPDQG